MRWINLKPNRSAALTLGLLPFGLLVGAYLAGSAARLAVNPDDKLLPSLVSLADAINRMAFIKDGRTGDYLLWSDTLASLERLGSGLAISTGIELVIGMIVGMLPYARALFAPVIAVIAHHETIRHCHLAHRHRRRPHHDPRFDAQGHGVAA